MFVEKINVNKYFVCLFLTSCLVRIVLHSAVQSHAAWSIEVYRCSKFQAVKLILTRTGQELVAVITEDRVVDASFRAQIERNNLYIYMSTPFHLRSILSS